MPSQPLRASRVGQACPSCSKSAERVRSGDEGQPTTTTNPCLVTSALCLERGARLLALPLHRTRHALPRSRPCPPSRQQALPTLVFVRRPSSLSHSSLDRADPLRATEYATFLHPNFEADAFAHAVLNGEDYPPPAEGEAPTGVPAGGTGFMKGLVGENGQGDVSAALARLNFGIEDLNRQLKGEVRPRSPPPLAPPGRELTPFSLAQVTKHHSSLLLQAASLGGLDNDLSEVRRGLAEVEGGVTRCVPVRLTPLSTRRADSRIPPGFNARSPRRTNPSPRHSSSSPASAAPPRSPAAPSASWSSRDGSRRRWPRSMELRRRKARRRGASGSASGERGQWQKRRSRWRKSVRALPLPLSTLSTALLTFAFLAETLVAAGEGVEPAEDDPEALLPIRSLVAVEAAIPAVELSRQHVVQEMETSVHRGLSELVRLVPLSRARSAGTDARPPSRAGPPSPRLVAPDRPQPPRPALARRQPPRRPQRPRPALGQGVLRHGVALARGRRQRCARPASAFPLEPH